MTTSQARHANELRLTAFFDWTPRKLSGDKFAAVCAGRRVKAMATQYGNWYGYIGGRNVKMFWGDYTDQQFEAFDWVTLMSQAAVLGAK